MNATLKETFNLDLTRDELELIHDVILIAMESKRMCNVEFQKEEDSITLGKMKNIIDEMLYEDCEENFECPFDEQCGDLCDEQDPYDLFNEEQEHIRISYRNLLLEKVKILQEEIDKL